MKKIACAAVIVTQVLILVSCNKNKVNPPTQSAAVAEDIVIDQTKLLNFELRRITSSQFLNKAQATFGMSFEVDAKLPDDLPKHSLISVGTKGATFSLRDIELYSQAAWEISAAYVASQAFENHFGSPCGSLTAENFSAGLKPIAVKLFHGKDESLKAYEQLFLDVKKDLKSQDSQLSAERLNCDGIQAALTSMMLSPQALYFETLSKTDELDDDPSDSFKSEYSRVIANELAYFLWDGPANDRLLKAAEEGKLFDENQRAQIIKDMMKDEARFQNGMKTLFGDWMSIAKLHSVANSTNSQTALAKSAINEFDFLVNESISSDDFITTFLKSNKTVLDQTLADTYGVDVSATILPTEDRSGFLTRSSFLMRGGSGATSPTKRGHFILQHLLCQDIPLPPPELDLSTGLPDDADKYQVIKARLDNSNCSGCHTLLDPIALGLEGYGQNGEVVAFPDLASYELPSMANQQNYQGGVELSDILAADPRVTECFAIHALRIAKGEIETRDARNEVKAIVEQFQKGSNKSVDELLYRILKSDLIIEPLEIDNDTKE